MTQTPQPFDTTPSRGHTWFNALVGHAPTVPGLPASLLVADTMLEQEHVRVLSVVPDPQNRFPRAQHGELGIDEGWGLASAVREVIDADQKGHRRAIIAVVDVPSQAYGRREEVLGIHLALAAAIDAYVIARLAGHPIVTLVVGKAISGGFLAHGAQANRVLALDDPKIMIQAMAKEEAARITMRSVNELTKLAETVIPMSFDVKACMQLGIVQKALTGINADAPTTQEIDQVKQELLTAITEIRSGSRDLPDWSSSQEVREHRTATLRVREQMEAQWHVQ
ncbi:biotin-independent malonate decarboxylase subunit gamma [Ktedonospora formicarum]|uniref:Biotin-independent malonate decarboxylase subunit gamma n=1 Tax=Ktedonospora formicarum TaxID=2778364 RepID=A0A8J3IFK7_9CHLR|nr:biotin-independent malonate decarboxylase subunit gamma [Ktedonospora formicarum]GHO50989.1 biotin-independent malonate decarboxylase subunit gamma [Ktedonospora formicarum]